MADTQNMSPSAQRRAGTPKHSKTAAPTPGAPAGIKPQRFSPVEGRESRANVRDRQNFSDTQPGGSTEATRSQGAERKARGFSVSHKAASKVANAALKAHMNFLQNGSDENLRSLHESSLSAVDKIGDKDLSTWVRAAQKAQENAFKSPNSKSAQANLRDAKSVLQRRLQDGKTAHQTGERRRVAREQVDQNAVNQAATTGVTRTRVSRSNSFREGGNK